MKRLTRAVAVQLLVLALLGVGFYLALRLLPVADWVGRMQREIGQMQWWGAVFYPALLAGCNLLLLPAGVLAVGSGLFFGLWWGFLLVWLGTVVGAAVAFQIGRRLGRQWLARKISRHQRWRALDQAIAAEGWKIVLLSQVHPLFPTSFLHYVYGVSRIRFWPCILWVAVGQAPGLFLYVYIGTLTQLGIKLYQGFTHPRLAEYATWFGGLVLTVVVTTLLARVAVRVLRAAHGLENGADAAPAPPAASRHEPADG